MTFTASVAIIKQRAANRRTLFMRTFKRISFDPRVMGGKPCIRGIRVTVGMIVGMLASGHSRETILSLYP